MVQKLFKVFDFHYCKIFDINNSIAIFDNTYLLL